MWFFRISGPNAIKWHVLSSTMHAAATWTSMHAGQWVEGARVVLENEDHLKSKISNSSLVMSMTLVAIATRAETLS